MTRIFARGVAIATAASLMVEVPTAVAQDATLQAALDSLRGAAGARGASAAVIFPDGRVWTGASGEASPNRPATPTTLFELGSITKTYTAALVLRLAAAGRLGLDDTLARWLPDFPDAGGVTLRQLLNHTSGIFNVTDDPRYVPALIQNPTRRWSASEQFEFVGPPSFKPGAGWRYSNTGYLLLGMVVERAGGASVGTQMRRDLLAPLGLTRTVFEAEDSLTAEKAHAFVDINNDGTAEDLSAIMPRTSFITAAWTAGAMSASAEDAARWMRALHNGPVLDAPSRQQMQTTVDRPDGNRHGLGLLIIGRDSSMLSGHLGNSAGFSSAVFHAPALGLTVALLTNADRVAMREPARALLVAATRHRAAAP
jgi:D-alanyl-D-alanine carboxypeptidase